MTGLRRVITGWGSLTGRSAVCERAGFVLYR